MPLFTVAIAKCDKCGREKPVRYPYPSAAWDELKATDGTTLAGWVLSYTSRPGTDGVDHEQVAVRCPDCRPA